ncbi:MAG: large conductance mechanosensitive channel protein MscL [Verrucomicrobiota bacterium]
MNPWFKKIEKPFQKANPVLKAFKTFALRGNVVDLAVGVITGTAFGKIVNSVVSDLIMPLLGPFTGKINFKDRFLTMDGRIYSSMEEAKKHMSVVTYGSFIETVIHFHDFAERHPMPAMHVGALRRHAACC